VATTYISAGSNQGEREAHLRRGIELLGQAGVTVNRVSSTFETEPVGYLDQPWFLNVVVEAHTGLTPHELLAVCQHIEGAEGRVRSFRNAPRTLDLDILFYDQLVLQTPDLVIPHPRLQARRFVLEPLADLAPQLLHPVRQEDVRSLLARCPDRSTVRLYPPGDRRP
jgi:2-amino-4-hydroxy-6-hydroxymethyldihydropteridine diphosphokinase